MKLFMMLFVFLVCMYINYSRWSVTHEGFDATRAVNTFGHVVGWAGVIIFVLIMVTPMIENAMSSE